jgi:hypothetical protein
MLDLLILIYSNHVTLLGPLGGSLDLFFKSLIWFKLLSYIFNFSIDICWPAEAQDQYYLQAYPKSLMHSLMQLLSCNQRVNDEKKRACQFVASHPEPQPKNCFLFFG